MTIMDYFDIKKGGTPQLNQPVLYNSGGSVYMDTWKGNLPSGHEMLSQEQAKQIIQQNISDQQSRLRNYNPDSATYKALQRGITTDTQKLNEVSTFSGAYDLAKAGGGAQYVIGPNGNLMLKSVAENYMPSPQEQARGIKPTGQYATGEYVTLPNGAIVPKGSAGALNPNPLAPAPAQPLTSATVPQGTAGAVQPTSYTVQAGDTLGAIAGKLGVPVSQLTGYRSGNPNLIYPGEMITVKGQTSEAKPVTLLSSKTGADTVTDNKTKLEAIQNVVNSFSGSANTPEQQAALKTFQSSMKAEIDAATAQGGLTADERAAGKKTQEARDALTTSAAKAQAALDAQDYSSMDYWVNKAQADRERYETELADYYSKTKDLRAQLTAKMTPSEKEQQLAQQVNDIKTEIQQRNLQLQKDKMAEYEGQQLQFAQGRASELNFKESFAQQELALKQANLLAELGLEQNAREMQSQSIEQQLEYLASDYNLQQQVSERIAASEEAVFQRADALEKNAKDTLVTLLDGLQGVNPAEMSPQSLAQLETLASRSGIPFSLITDALSTQYQKITFDEALRASQEARLGADKTDVEITPEDKRNLLGAGFTTTEASQIASDVNQYGIDKVLEGITDPAQKKAIQKTYGVQEKVTREQIAGMVTQKMAQEGLKDTYTDDELSTLARDNGFSLWFTGKAGEVEKFLNSPKAIELYTEILYKQYKDAGMAD